jgi:hypothetical protein
MPGNPEVPVENRNRAGARRVHDSPIFASLIVSVAALLAVPALADQPKGSGLPPHVHRMKPDEPQYQFAQLVQLANPEHKDDRIAQGLTPETMYKLADHVRGAMNQIRAMSRQNTDEICAQKDTINRETMARLVAQLDADTHAFEKKIVADVPALIGPEQAAIFQRVVSTITITGTVADGAAAIRSPDYPYKHTLAEWCR